MYLPLLQPIVAEARAQGAAGGSVSQQLLKYQPTGAWYISLLKRATDLSSGLLVPVLGPSSWSRLLLPAPAPATRRKQQKILP